MGNRKLRVKRVYKILFEQIPYNFLLSFENRNEYQIKRVRENNNKIIEVLILNRANLPLQAKIR